MTDESVRVIAHIGSGTIEMGGGAKVPLSAIPMNVVYFENAPSLSHLNGIIGITLTVGGNVPTSDGIIQCASVVAFLKCNIPAAMALRNALDSALLLAQPVENPKGKTN